MTNLLVYGTQNDTVHKPDAAILLNQLAVVLSNIMIPWGRLMTAGAILEPPFGLF
jgi:hypothetical protein